ncbi:MAG: CDP-glucose 4,6-dehydratase [Nevskia sp.]|nr:CDP-glucose 4,6-dehydratase [Nevskia sp.]
MGVGASALEELVSGAAAFWPGRRVFLTGHTGFKGGWLALWLRRLGAIVHGYALAPPTEPNLFSLARVGEGLHSVIADLDDCAALRRAVEQARPEVVFHLAAQALVHEGYEDPAATYRTNVLGTVHLLDAVRHCPGVRAVVNVTSDKCYENREWEWGYRENDRLGGYDPYSSSKACAELVTDSFRNAFFPPARHAEHGVALASARAGNVIGGGDWGRDRLLPDVFRAIDAGASALIRRPQAVRPWQHVLEPLQGYLLLAQRLVEQGAAFGEGWNFGPPAEDAQPVREVVERLVRAWGAEARWHCEPIAAGAHEAGQLRLDCAKARARLGWQPRLRLEQALDWTVAWHRARRRDEDLRAESLRQIAAYEAQGAA